MNPLTESEIRNSFVNCSRGEAKQLKLPDKFDEINWEQLEYLGWRDPKAEQRAYVVTPWQDGIVGLSMRSQVKSGKGYMRSSMCSLCMTVHSASGVSVFVAPRAGKAGRDANTIGTYMCANLKCSLYIRGILKSEAATTMEESLDLPARIDRLQSMLDKFLANVIRPEVR